MIDYTLISQAQDYYNAEDYKKVEVPWTVTKEVSDITRPDGAVDFELKHKNNKVLIASGEQGFLYQCVKGYLPVGRYQTVTPCFRFENHDLLHQKNFMKLELFITDFVSTKMLDNTIECCLSFFRRYLPEAVVVETDVGCDIVHGNVELGSYGIRKHSHMRWIYATGIAEPRFSNEMRSL